MSDATTVAAAKSWIDGLNSGLGIHGSWRLQRLERRSKVHIESSADSSSEITVSDLPTRLRRFAKGIPWSLVPDAVNYLHTTIPYTGIVVNGFQTDVKYVPTRTWWERDEGSVVDRGQQNEGTYTLYQDLIDKDHTDDELFDAGGSCSEKITARYVYNAFSVEDVPRGGVGETVSVQAVSRSEDGTFSYAVIVRKAITKSSGAHIVKDDAFEKVTLQLWDNLYFDGTSYKDDNGNAVEVPVPSNSGNGTVIEVTPRQNDDCTFQVSAQTTVSKQIVSSKSSSATIFEKTKGSVRRVEDSTEYSPVNTASGGKVFSRKVEKRPDGKTDLTEESKTEQSVGEAVWEKRKTLRSVKVSRTDRNQNQAKATAAKSFVTRIGQSVRIQKTDGGLADITYESVTSESVGTIREECQKTSFLHVHSKTDNTKTDPGDIDVSDASDGVVHIVSKSRTEDGTFDVTSETRSEITNDSAVVEKRKTLRSVKTSKTHRNKTKTEAETAVANVVRVGQSVRIEKTDGGRYNVTVESVESSPAGEIRREQSKTLFQHTRSVTVNQAESESDEVTFESDGHVRIKTVAKTEDGTFDVTEESRIEQSVADAVIEIRKTARSTRISRTNRNVAKIDLAGAKEKVTKAGQTIRIERTDGGLANVTEESTTDSSVPDLREECQKTVFVHKHSKTRSTKTSVTPTASASGGVIKTVSVSKTDDGMYDVTDESQSELAYPRSQRTVQRTPFKTVVVYKDTTATTVALANDSISDILSQLAYQENQGTPAIDGSFSRKIQQEFEVSQGGLASQTKTFSYAKAVSWTTPAVSTNYKFHKTWKFRNFSKTQLNQLLTGSTDGNGKNGVYGWFDAKVNSWVNDNRPPSSHDVDCDATLNDDGFFDGQVTADARWSVGTAGQNGAVGAIISSVEWTYYHFDPASDKNYTIGPSSVWDGTWNACKYSMLRIIGRGKALLDKFTAHTACMRPPSVSYNPETGVWTLEIQNGFYGIYSVSQATFAPSTWRWLIRQASSYDAPNTTQISAPSLPSGTEWGAT